MNSFIHVKKEIIILKNILLTVWIGVIIGIVIWFLIKADHHGKVESNSLLLVPLHINRDASYDTPALSFDKNTEIIGDGTSLNDLRDGQEVKVWLHSNKKKVEKIKIIH